MQKPCDKWCLGWSKGQDPTVYQALVDGGLYCAGIQQVSLIHTRRICGPEAGCRWQEENSQFRARVEAMKLSIAAGWEPPPLLLSPRGGWWIIRDGNHRAQALWELGIEKVSGHILLAGPDASQMVRAGIDQASVPLIGE